jgi:hypothetical protein
MLTPNHCGFSAGRTSRQNAPQRFGVCLSNPRMFRLHSEAAKVGLKLFWYVVSVAPKPDFFLSGVSPTGFSPFATAREVCL